MYKITKKYTDFNNVERTEDFYFNFTETELLEMEVGVGAFGFTETMQQIINAQNHQELLKQFKVLVVQAYGERTADGGFLKNDEIRARFTAKQAYSDIFVELATNTKAAIDFVNGVVPASARKKAEEQQANSAN